MPDTPLSPEDQACVDWWLAISEDYHRTLAAVLETTETAMVNASGCDMCTQVLEMVPRDIPAFLAALEHAGPILDRTSIEVGIRSFAGVTSSGMRAAMSRRDPDRIYQAQRAGIFARLTQNERVDELDAEHWIARWEREAEVNGPARGSQGYWDAAWPWITENRRRH